MHKHFGGSLGQATCTFSSDEYLGVWKWGLVFWQNSLIVDACIRTNRDKALLLSRIYSRNILWGAACVKNQINVFELLCRFGECSAENREKLCRNRPFFLSQKMAESKCVWLSSIKFSYSYSQRTYWHDGHYLYRNDSHQSMNIEDWIVDLQTYWNGYDEMCTHSA